MIRRWICQVEQRRSIREIKDEFGCHWKPSGGYSNPESNECSSSLDNCGQWSQLGDERIKEYIKQWKVHDIDSVGKYKPYYYWSMDYLILWQCTPSCRIYSAPSSRISTSILSLPPWHLWVSLSFPMVHIVSRIKTPILTSIARTGLWPWNSLIMVHPRKWVDYCSLMQHPFTLVWPSGPYLLPQMAIMRSGRSSLKSLSWVSTTRIILFATQTTRVPGT